MQGGGGGGDGGVVVVVVVFFFGIDNSVVMFLAVYPIAGLV